MIRIAFSIPVLIALAALASPMPARAAESYDNCTGFIDALPAIISSQGTWCLRDDQATAVTMGYAILVKANNVTIDCNHFKIGGLGGGAATSATGILATGWSNVTVRHCNIRGFFSGVHLNAANGGHLVEDNSFDGNTMFGLQVSGPGATVRRNQVTDTGGSSVLTSHAIGIHANGGVDVIDNTISGVAPIGENASPYGVLVSNNGDASIVGNRVRDLASSGTGVPHGIQYGGPGRLVIHDNHVLGPGPTVAGGIGIECQDNLATARGNVVAGFETGVAACLSSSNSINLN